MRFKPTGKQRTTRIPLDYIKRADLFARIKLLLGFGALLVTLLWLVVEASAVLLGHFGVRLPTPAFYSRGPLAQAHATWDDECAACHAVSQPVAAQANWLGRLGLQTTNESCRSCHRGTTHHASMQPEDEKCADCHRDHQGRSASLVRVADAACTQCHADLARHVAGETPPRFTSAVMNFAGGHPPFRLRRSDLTEPVRDPGKLKFNHQLHLARGMALPNGAPFFRLGDIRDREARGRYRRSDQPDSDFVQLDCGACHQVDSADFGLPPSRMLLAGLTNSREVRAAMRPITYENQCKACHVLTFDPRLPPERAVPHRLQPNELDDYLTNLYGALAARGEAASAPSGLDRPFPGKAVAPDAGPATKPSAASLADLRRQFYLGKKLCGECHYFEGPMDKPVRVVPPAVPEVWFEHGHFDHTAHRAVDCKECHAAASTSTQAPDVLLGTGDPAALRDLCKQCHAPRSHGGGTPTGGASTACTECHRYHNGDAPLQGVGARARSVEADQRLDIHRFLSGNTAAP